MENAVNSNVATQYKDEPLLNSMRVGQRVMISAIKSCPAELLRKLVSMGLQLKDSPIGFDPTLSPGYHDNGDDFGDDEFYAVEPVEPRAEEERE